MKVVKKEQQEKEGDQGLENMVFTMERTYASTPKVRQLYSNKSPEPKSVSSGSSRHLSLMEAAPFAGDMMADTTEQKLTDEKIAASEARTETKIESIRGDVREGFANQRVWFLVTILTVLLAVFGNSFLGGNQASPIIINNDSSGDKGSVGDADDK